MKDPHIEISAQETDQNAPEVGKKIIAPLNKNTQPTSSRPADRAPRIKLFERGDKLVFGPDCEDLQAGTESLRQAFGAEDPANRVSILLYSELHVRVATSSTTLT